MYTMLRRASRSLLPLAARALEAPRPFRGAISAALNSGKGGLVPALNGASSLRFSTLVKSSSDEALVRIIDAEIECAQDFDTIATMPEGFPFRIQDHPGESTISMEREYRDETIQVRAVTISNGGEEDRRMIPMVVTISKGSGFYLEVGVTAFPDKISIDSLSMKHSDASDEQLLYEGREFNELDKNLQKAFQKYLEVRGINANTSNLLYEYMTSKDQKEYLMWLKNFKQFILQ